MRNNEIIKFSYKEHVMNDKENTKQALVKKLKAGHYFWSYDLKSVKNIPDDILIEMVMLHLDLNEINQLFDIYPYKKIKQCWIENLIPQGEYLYTLNKFFAWYYFKMKRPGIYVKSMITKQLNKIGR